MGRKNLLLLPKFSRGSGSVVYLSGSNDGSIRVSLTHNARYGIRQNLRPGTFCWVHAFPPQEPRSASRIKAKIIEKLRAAHGVRVFGSSVIGVDRSEAIGIARAARLEVN